MLSFKAVSNSKNTRKTFFLWCEAVTTPPLICNTFPLQIKPYYLRIMVQYLVCDWKKVFLFSLTDRTETQKHVTNLDQSPQTEDTSYFLEIQNSLVQ